MPMSLYFIQFIPYDIEMYCLTKKEIKTKVSLRLSYYPLFQTFKLY